MNKRISALDLSCVDSIILNMSYGFDEETKEGFRLYIQKIKSNNSFFVLVAATHYVNPTERARETFSKILRVFNAYGLPSAEIMDSIYLDLSEIKGYRSKYLYKWKFRVSNKIFSDEIISVDDVQLSDAIENALKNYYKIRSSSIITDSPLSIRDKAEIVAMYFKDICLNEVSIETVAKYVRNALYHFKNKRDIVARLNLFYKTK